MIPKCQIWWELDNDKKNGDYDFFAEIPTLVVPLGIEPSTY